MSFLSGNSISLLNQDMFYQGAQTLSTLYSLVICYMTSQGFDRRSCAVLRPDVAARRSCLCVGRLLSDVRVAPAMERHESWPHHRRTQLHKPRGADDNNDHYHNDNDHNNSYDRQCICVLAALPNLQRHDVLPMQQWIRSLSDKLLW